MKSCKFCAEEVKDEAIKCKHCGSMLVETSIDPMRATDPAKAVVKGLKQKELHDSLFKFWATIIVIFSLVIGYSAGAGMGWGLLIVSGIILNIWYYRE